METDVITIQEEIFRTACVTRTCPKCTNEQSRGYVVGPQWEPTSQGLVYTAKCVNCGWRANSTQLVIDHNMPTHQLSEHVQSMKRLTRNREYVRITRDLSKYTWG
jgi:hypothetical protein